jgi:hypothetical protein
MATHNALQDTIHIIYSMTGHSAKNDLSIEVLRDFCTRETFSRSVPGVQASFIISRTDVQWETFNCTNFDQPYTSTPGYLQLDLASTYMYVSSDLSPCCESTITCKRVDLDLVT